MRINPLLLETFAQKVAVPVNPRLELYRRRLGYQPWAAFELEGMHNNVVRIRERGLKSNDCWYRQTGRTTKGLLTFLADTMQQLEGRLSVTQFVLSPYGTDATRWLVQRCLDLADCVGIQGLKVEGGRGGYVDHDKVLTYPVNLHLDRGVTHVWNHLPSLTCLECLALL
jgi:hypothetical protein